MTSKQHMVRVWNHVDFNEHACRKKENMCMHVSCIKINAFVRHNGLH